MSESDEISESVSSVVNEINSMTEKERALVVLYLFPIVLGQDILIELCQQWIHAVAEVEQIRSTVQELPVYSESGAVKAMSQAEVNPRALAQAVSRGELIEYMLDGEKVYPTFQFDVKSRAVIPIVTFVNKALLAGDYPIPAGKWWIAETGFYGKTPHELLTAGLLDRSTAEWILDLKDVPGRTDGEFRDGAESDGIVSGFPI